MPNKRVLSLSFLFSLLASINTSAAGVGTEKAQGKMVYLHEVGETRRIALAESLSEMGQFIRFLTPETQDTYHPETSADGKYVAYSIGKIQPGNSQLSIHVLNLDSNEVEVWTPKGNQYIHAEFSGNGEYLAYSGPIPLPNGATRQSIHLIHLPTERAKGEARIENKSGQTFKYYEPDTEIINDQAHAYFPAVSSDGSFVIYHRTLNNESHSSLKELALYDRRTKKIKRLTPENTHAMVPSLSADNRYVAYASVQNGQWDIHMMDLWTETHEQLTNDPIREFTPTFSPDGSIVYTRILESNPIELDLYRISSGSIASRKRPVSSSPFIAAPGVFEYVPSFSGDLWFNLEAAPPLPEPARSSFGATQHQGKIYVAGGHQGPEHTYPRESFLDRLDIYDVKTKSWSQGASMSVPRHGFEMVAYGRYIYAFGGFAFSDEHSPKWKSLDIVERYNIAQNRWEVLKARLPRSRSSNIAAVVGSKVYLIGGWDSTPKSAGDKEGYFHREIDVFNLQSETFSVSDQTLPDPLRRAFTAVTHENEIYLLGGIAQGSSHFDWVDNVTVFSPETATWRELSKLPFATFAPGAGIYRDQLFFFGGMNLHSGYVNTVFSFDLASSGSWINTGRYLKENKGFPIVVDLPRGALGILGGHTYLFHDDRIVDTPVPTFEILK